MKGKRALKAKMDRMICKKMRKRMSQELRLWKFGKKHTEVMRNYIGSAIVAVGVEMTGADIYNTDNVMNALESLNAKELIIAIRRLKKLP